MSIKLLKLKSIIFLLSFLAIFVLASFVNFSKAEYKESSETLASDFLLKNFYAEEKQAEKFIYSWGDLSSLKKSRPPQYIAFISAELKYESKSNFSPTARAFTDGILFTYKKNIEKQIYISGSFNNWALSSMSRNRNGVYFYFHKLPFGRDAYKEKTKHQFQYRFLINDVWAPDPNQKSYSYNKFDEILSVYYLPDRRVNKSVSMQILEKYRVGRTYEYLVEFRFYAPNAKSMYLIGEFNNWNMSHDAMIKYEDGIFRIKKKIASGNYLYKYVIDGKWILDKYNYSTKYDEKRGLLCSFLELH